jgi:hypothetical protein
VLASIACQDASWRDALTPSLHPIAPRALPAFISSPDGTDYLMVAMAIFLVAFVLATGILYLRLHALPDHIAHKSQKVQYEIVCVLGLLAMFTHVHAFWIAGLLIALIDLPDFSTPLRRISGALDRIASDGPTSSRPLDGAETNVAKMIEVANPASEKLPTRARSTV